VELYLHSPNTPPCRGAQLKECAGAAQCGGAMGVLVLGGPPSGSRWPLRRVSMKIQNKKLVTEKVYILTDKDCETDVIDLSTHQGGRLMTSSRNCLNAAEIWS
jgi:hypothetical protein